MPFYVYYRKLDSFETQNIIHSLPLLLSRFFLNLCLLVTKVGIPGIPFESVDIESDDDDDSEHNLPEIIENALVVVDKEDPKRDNAYRPDNRSDHIVHPELIFSHPTCTRDEGDKGASKIMKLSKYDIPESILFDLFVEDACLGLAEPDPVTIFFDNFYSVPFPDPVSEVVPEHRSDDRRDDSS